jgi:hypothetical protein
VGSKNVILFTFYNQHDKIILIINLEVNMSTKSSDTKPVPKPKSKAKPTPKVKPVVETPAPEVAIPVTEPTPETEPDIPLPTPPSLAQLADDIQYLRLLGTYHSLQIAQVMEALARKRKPASSVEKVQIKDTHTGTLYPSKNGAYQSLLKSGDLKELVEKGVFGPNPDKNTFGWYALVREWPDRFEEVKQQP